MIELKPFAPGVAHRRERLCDVFVGSADGLVLAGLVRLDQLPGQPGNSPTMTTLYADDEKASRGGRQGRGREAGKKTIHSRRRGGEQVFEVWVNLSREQIEEMQAAEQQFANCWPFQLCFGTPPAGEVRA